jgi:hypothetical protein
MWIIPSSYTYVVGAVQACNHKGTNDQEGNNKLDRIRNVHHFAFFKSQEPLWKL